MKDKRLVIKCFFLNLKNKNRFRWNCPDCSVGRNVRNFGGNKNCFHCGNYGCGFVECSILFFRP